MRVLVVGCGYVGLPLAAKLAGLGHKVAGARRTAAAESELCAAGVEPVIADISRPEQLEALPGPFDWVVNCVSSSHGGTEDYRRVYLQGTRHLLDRLATMGLRKFVYTGSTSVYGQNDGSIVTEESPAKPVTETGQILLDAENLLREAFRDRGFPAVILRLAGIYGPGRGYWWRRFLAGDARLEGDGQRVLNMIHRDDVIGAVQAALACGAPGETYNAVDDEPATQLELFQWLATTTSKTMPQTEPANPGKRGASNKRVSNRKLKEQLGYRFKYPTFRDGFAADYGNSLSR
jgi:nucleoside-diphosphate-sugar epimerase